ncbi:hypothetical protein HW555_013413 [Spodoptera exigua]|uniref:MADF domain-containing protein n=1 Tax=Spodoptera exigua TaxID=7107 RepID=A0A835G3H0_SPOEX|nr:hypothetical protein HW555_013413 [Spodoptera exigua]
MAVVWDDETVFKLIELFEKKRILWDCSTKDYKNKIKKNDAWEEISNALAIPKTDVENKMHILRSQFARERKKMLSTKTTGAGAADIKKSKWKFYEELIFLQSTTTRVGGADTLNETANREDLLATEEPEQQSEQQKPQSPLPPSPLPSTSSKKASKRKVDDNLSEVFEIVKSAKCKMDESKDEYDIYGQYVASELRAVQNETAVIQAKAYVGVWSSAMKPHSLVEQNTEFIAIY